MPAVEQQTTNIINEATKIVFSTDTIGPFLGALIIFIAVYYVFYYLTHKQTRGMIKENNIQNQEMMKLALDSSAKTSLEVGRSIAKELVTSVSEHFNEHSKKLDRNYQSQEETRDVLLVMGTKMDMVFKDRRVKERRESPNQKT